MEFKRSEDYMANITMDAICVDVQLDVDVLIVKSNGKLKAYSPKLKVFLQFPKAIRTYGGQFKCDCVEATNGGRKFYRFYKGSIRDTNGNLVG